MHEALDPEYSILKQRLARRLRYEGAEENGVQDMSLVVRLLPPGPSSYPCKPTRPYLVSKVTFRSPASDFLLIFKLLCRHKGLLHALAWSRSIYARDGR